MQSHTPGSSFYDLDLSDPWQESRNTILLDSQKNYIPLFCRHCDDPQCADLCMSGAMAKDQETGHVRYDANKCASCFMCVMNCPYGVLKPDRATQTYVVKCDFCVEHGEDPRCVKKCPQKAIYVEVV